MSINDIGKLQFLLSGKIISSEAFYEKFTSKIDKEIEENYLAYISNCFQNLFNETLAFSLPREFKEKIIIMAFNYIFDAKLFIGEISQGSEESYELFIEKAQEIIIASTLIVIKSYGDCNQLHIVPSIFEFSIENQINFENVCYYEVEICKNFDWNLGEILSPNEFFEILYQFLKMKPKANSYDKDVLLEYYNKFLDEIFFTNSRMLLKFNVGILSASIFYHALMFIEDTMLMEPFKNFILAFLIFPVCRFEKFSQLQDIMKTFPQKERESFSAFFSEIDGCCSCIYDLFMRN